MENVNKMVFKSMHIVPKSCVGFVNKKKRKPPLICDPAKLKQSA